MINLTMPVLIVSMTILGVSTQANAGNPYNIADGCLPYYQEYQATGETPKAFVAAKNGRCGSWHGGNSPAQVKAKAMQLCQTYGGTACRLVEHVDQ